MKPLLCTAMLCCVPANAQTAASAVLRLKLEAGPDVRGLPASFIYTIVNASDHDIRLPQPVVNCGDVYLGEVWVHVRFTSVGHTIAQESHSGCVNDYVAHTPAMKRAESWQVLHPGESLSQTVSQEQLHYDARKAGHYEIWAEYRPPYLSPEEQRTLRKAGIAFPSAEISTPHLHSQSKP